MKNALIFDKINFDVEIEVTQLLRSNFLIFSISFYGGIHVKLL